MSEPDRTPDAEEPPPFGGSWRRLYAVVLLNLALWILVMALVTRALS